MKQAEMNVANMHKLVMDMKVGELGWTAPWAILVDKELKCYINKSFLVFGVPLGTVSLRIQRVSENEWIADIERCSFKWARHSFLKKDFLGFVIGNRIERKKNNMKANKLNLWRFISAWRLCRCPYDKKAQLCDRILLIGKLFKIKKNKIALLLYLFNIKPRTSTFIDDETITMGYGKEGGVGSFEYPLPRWVIKRKYNALTWNEYKKIYK